MDNRLKLIKEIAIKRAARRIRRVAKKSNRLVFEPVSSGTKEYILEETLQLVKNLGNHDLTNRLKTARSL